MKLKYIRNEQGHYVCPICGTVKENQNTMHYHIKRHADSLPHVCKICKKGFLQKQTLDLHMTARHPDVIAANDSRTTKEFVCPVDGCAFKALAKGNCRVHILRVHFQEEVKEIMKVDDDKTIKCDICNDTFNSPGAFYYHCHDCIILAENDTRKQYLHGFV
jgi:hypothetical protein